MELWSVHGDMANVASRRDFRGSVMPGYRLLSLKKSGRDIIVSVESEAEDEIPECVQCGSADCVPGRFNRQRGAFID